METPPPTALVAHPAFAPLHVTVVEARILAPVPGGEDWLRLRWRINGTAALIVPPLAGRQRHDGLWQTTCGELFVAHPAGVAEFNFAPSEAYAAYDFTGYRQGMANRALPRPPVIDARVGGDVLILDVALPRAALPPPPWRYGLCAVIAEQAADGDVRKSYWALAHGRDRPDFHDPACFAAIYPAAIDSC